MAAHPNRTRRALLGTAVAAAVAQALPSPLAHAAAVIGRAAPALIVDMLDGARFDLAALEGRVVVLNFWATWCPPCRAEMPLLDQFYRDHREAGLELLGLSADRRNDLPAVRAAMQPFAYPAALLAQASVNGFGRPPALPMTFVVDADGVLRERLIARGRPLERADLATAVLPLLARGARQ
jgi:cytochrome c biogenesis protein CcmG/thiol:disulfide interchange protein DsbE